MYDICMCCVFKLETFNHWVLAIVPPLIYEHSVLDRLTSTNNLKDATINNNLTTIKTCNNYRTRLIRELYVLR